VVVVDPMTEVVTFIGGVPGVQPVKYAGAALARNGNIYACPFHAANVLVTDTATNTVHTIALGAIAGPFMDAVRVGDGRIFCMPYNWLVSMVLVIDPVTETLSTIAAPSGTWSGGALGANGKVYGVPGTTVSGLLVIDPFTNTTSSSPLPVGVVDYVGAVVAPNGVIYGVPRTATQVLRIDSSTGTATVIGPILAGGASSKYRGGAVGPDGLVYFPRSTGSPGTLVLDPATDTITIAASPYSLATGAVLAPDGRIWSMEFGNSLVAMGVPRTTPLPIDVLLRATSSSF
jgi:streptogramin lyase